MSEEANGVECLECGAASEGSDLTSDCDVCNGETRPVLITDCEIGNTLCNDDAHHYGIGKHVKEMSR